MKGLLCSGNIVVDRILWPVNGIRWGASVWVKPFVRSLGGNGANTAYAAAKMGTPVRLLGMVGEDEDGKFARDVLESAGVDLTGLQTGADSTAATVALVNDSGERCFLHSPGVSQIVFDGPIEFTPELAQNCSHYHLASPFSLPKQRPHLEETLRRAKAAGLQTSVDTQWDSHGGWMRDLAPSLPFVDLLFVNQLEAQMLTDCSDPSAAAHSLQRKGASIVVIKLGAEGCGVFAGEDENFSPAFDLPVVDTTGAGDCFVGAFLASLMRGSDFQTSATLANAAAGLSIGELGSSPGVPDLNSALEVLSTRAPRTASQSAL